VKIPFATIILASLLALSAGAQCPQPDLLDDLGNCIFAEPSLPAFLAVQTLSVGICWNDCAVESQNPVLAKWGQLRPAQTAAIPPLCTIYIARLDLADPVTGVNEWGRPIRCFYSRTWVENDSLGRQLQVWRFLTNGDLRPTATAGPTPCPVPPCAAAFTNRVHSLRVNWGSYAMRDFCNLVPPSGDYCYGVTTLGGFQAFALSFSGVGSALPLTFLDQGTSLDTNSFDPVLGTKYVTSALLNLNF